MVSNDLPLILIADDEPANLQVLVEILCKHYRIKVATNGRIALDLANRKDQPALIILDIQMPEMDGFEVCRSLKKNSETRDIPVMFVTSMSNSSAEFEGLQLEAMEFINKPVNPSTLHMRARNLVRLKLMQDQLKHLSTHDTLTGIANRRHFDDSLKGEWRRAMRLGTSVGLIMLDIDHFKQFNDQYGHVAGDGCLQKVGQVLTSAAQRPGDLAARYGGEEFAIILDSSEMNSVIEIAEKCRAEIEAMQIPHELSPFGIVTVSIGVKVLLPSDACTRIDLVEQADQNLYQAKELGRNRVVA